jgi:hypothetical protein
VEPGWQIDPSGRFDYRYFNGVQWTSDVAVNGHRFVDAPVASGLPSVPERRPPRGMAITAFVLALCGVVLGWIPFIFIFATGAAIGAIVFGILGLRSARRHDGRGRGFSITALVLSPFALAVCVGGFFITRSVVREFRAYLDPGPHEVVTESCTLTDGRATLHATIHNLDDHVHDYRIEVTFTGNDGDSGDDTVTVDNVGPDATSQWTAGSELAGSSVTCKVTDVFGPLPFEFDNQG